jgi:endonuclease/exonuclease/phosphatase family metal-dependent hydrolase
VAFDPYMPYGPLVETTLRVVTWNVWGRYGAWEDRQHALEGVLAQARPDVVCLVESWAATNTTQPARIAAELGMEYSLFDADWAAEGWTSGVGIVCRWPIASHERRPLTDDRGDGPGSALFVTVDGPHGLVQLFVVMLDYPLNASARRQAQVRQLCAFVDELTRRRHITILCGDFNAGPDSDEMRMLTGRSATPVPELVFYDAWEVAGDGSAGITWSNQNPLAAIGRYPDRRFDYILSAWPRSGAAGHPVNCELLGVRPNRDETQISDHYGVLADLRY